MYNRVQCDECRKYKCECKPDIEESEIRELETAKEMVEAVQEVLDKFHTTNKRAASWVAGASGKLEHAVDDIDAAVSEIEN